MKINFDTGNAAFDNEGGGDMAEEVARILRKIAEAVYSGATSGTIYDSNGNRVGEWSL